MCKTKLKFLELNLEYNREDPAERARYEARRKYQLDYNTALLTAYEESIEEGREIEKIVNIKQMLKHNIPVEQIAAITRLSVEEVCALKN